MKKEVPLTQEKPSQYNNHHSVLTILVTSNSKWKFKPYHISGKKFNSNSSAVKGSSKI